MRKYLVAMTMLVTLGVGLPVMAQRQQPKDGQELVDSTQKSDALEAYSDTTDVADDTTVVSRHHRIGGYTNSIDNVNNIFERVFGIGVGGMAAGMVFVLLVLFILFVLAPVIILIVLFYFINKNRKQKMKLAEMAMKQGQPIPDQLLVEQNYLNAGKHIPAGGLIIGTESVFLLLYQLGKHTDVNDKQQQIYLSIGLTIERGCHDTYRAFEYDSEI